MDSGTTIVILLFSLASCSAQSYVAGNPGNCIVNNRPVRDGYVLCGGRYATGPLMCRNGNWWPSDARYCQPQRPQRTNNGLFSNPLVALLLLGNGDLFSSGSGTTVDCSQPLGMRNGDIPDADITSTAGGLTPEDGRLRGTGAWTGTGTMETITVDLGTRRTVTSIATQGDPNVPGTWVTNYMVEYSTTGTPPYTSIGTFPANADDDTAVVRRFASSVSATHIRVTPTAINTGGGAFGLRLELYGCKTIAAPANSNSLGIDSNTLLLLSLLRSRQTPPQ